MRSYTFKVVLERDRWPDQSDSEAVWRAYIPELQSRGAASWGTTQQEALENLQNAVSLLLEHMQEQGEEIPDELRSEIQITDEPQVTVNV